MWSYVIGTLTLLAAFAGIFYGGVEYGTMRAGQSYSAQRLQERDATIEQMERRLEAEKGSVDKAQADLLAMQTDLATIASRTATVGQQLRSTLNAAGFGVCIIDDESRKLRAGGYERAADAARAANRARAGAG
ncbi:MAG: hypothetical protein IPL86_16095 [Flavobacteriales bacterium]|nr:hypothetical protein [Flavobacteriales bacterium]